MSTLQKLQYGERFGDDIRKVARAALTVASESSEAEVASARYARWFRGEGGETEPMATSARKFRKITPGMAIGEVVTATKENLSILGDDASSLFASKLPSDHRMRRVNRASVLHDVPHLGTCKFGEVITDRSRDAFAVTQIYIANFDGELDTASRSGSIYKPKSRDFDQMFFGLNLIVDRDGNPLGFNQKLGKNGVAFQTRNVTEALYHIASASTGLTLEALQARALAARKATT